MTCFPFSSRLSRGHLKLRFSWSFFSHGSSSEGKASSNSKPTKSAPSSCSFQAHTELQSSSSSSHIKQQASSFQAITELQSSSLSSHAKQQVNTEQEGDESSSMKRGMSQRALEVQVFTYAELQAVTNNFSRTNLLGEGGFGCVYRGALEGTNPNDSQSSKDVAVKRLNRNGQQGHKEWLAEVRFLGLVEHPNLMKLVGYCAEDDERGIQRLLVYEYMSRGSLEDYLFHKEHPALPWHQRLQIMLGTAQGLTYLHEEMEGIQVIFRDFKTSNVLLDKDWTPKLSDFGLARQGPEMGASHVSTSVVGTLGYAAPEYVQTGRLTSKSDVWSFGVVLFEVLTGRRSLDRNRPKSEQHLLEWVRPYLHGSKKLHVIMDSRLDGEYSLIQAQQVVDLALHCSHRAPKARPSMSVVVKRLKHILAEGSEAHHSDAQLRMLSVEEKGVSKSKQRKEPLKKPMLSLEDVRTGVWPPKPIPA